MDECFFAFPENPSICPVLFLKKYLAKTNLLCYSDAKSLFVSLIKPYKCVTSQALARWIIQLMSDTGIDNDVTKHHSTCSALASSIEKTMGISVVQICKTVSLSDKHTTLQKFYKRVVNQTE